MSAGSNMEAAPKSEHSPQCCRIINITILSRVVIPLRAVVEASAYVSAIVPENATGLLGATGEIKRRRRAIPATVAAGIAGDRTLCGAVEPSASEQVLFLSRE